MNPFTLKQPEDLWAIFYHAGTQQVGGKNKDVYLKKKKEVRVNSFIAIRDPIFI